jgi:hypothetical protein
MGQILIIAVRGCAIVTDSPVPVSPKSPASGIKNVCKPPFLAFAAQAKAPK